jgi:alkylation response protein AidB-like acyl-CoA dehydrogenase
LRGLIEIADAAAELNELRAAADDVLCQAWAVDRTRELLDAPDSAFDDTLWETVIELGWPDVLVSEANGGGGGDVRQLCVLAEAAGAVTLPVPLATVAAAAWSEDRCVEGVTILLEDGGARITESGVTGSWPLVPFGDIATRLVAIAHRDDEEPVLGVIDPNGAGVTRESQRPLDHSPAASITLDEAPLVEIATGHDAAQRHRDAVFRARLATISELIGVADSANEAATEYAKVRTTFGRPIGSRQAIKHRLVDHRLTTEVARALVNRAADACEHGQPDAEALVSLAAFWAIDRLRRVPEGATQVFGGIAYTWEHNAHVYLRRAATIAATLGPRSQHRAAISDWLRVRYDAQR